MANFIDEYLLDTCYLYDHNYQSDDIKKRFKCLGPYIVFGDINQRPWIVAYGGSTTSPIQGSQWARMLKEELQSRGLDVCVLVGACGGHNSWNELNKMLRDLPTYKPELVISFSGVNDYTAHVNPMNPYINTHGLNELLETGLFVGQNIPPANQDHADAFITRTDYMYLACKIHNSKFIRIIQPTLGYGDYKYDLSDSKDSEFYSFTVNDDQFKTVERLRRFYQKLSIIAKSNQRAYLYDETNLFDGCSRLFTDYRHPNPEGYRIIANRLATIVLQLFNETN